MNKTDKTVRATFTCLISHMEKLRKMSDETYISMSALIRKALNEFFEKNEKDNKND